MGKIIDKDINKNLSGIRNFLIMLKNLQQMCWKFFKKRGLIGNKIANRITKVLKNSKKNNSDTVTNEHD